MLRMKEWTDGHWRRRVDRLKELLQRIKRPAKGCPSLTSLTIYNTRDASHFSTPGLEAQCRDAARLHGICEELSAVGYCTQGPDLYLAGEER
jgi:hypothetical protein